MTTPKVPYARVWVNQVSDSETCRAHGLAYGRAQASASERGDILRGERSA
jgi:hypothetical protein